MSNERVQFEQLVAKKLDIAQYKHITKKHSGEFANILKALEIIRKFIQTRQLILYGGIAIDYALRLKGDKIYNDDDLPDYDFWSPNHIATAQELVDLLNVEMPGVNIYGYRAKFIRTMRVSIGSNNWVADITYLPPELFERMPTLTYDNMRVVHPHFQFSDLHSSLSFPFDNPPQEVIFERWQKDIDRYVKLWNYYPLENVAKVIRPCSQIGIPRQITSHSILSGFAAYSFYYSVLRQHTTIPDDIPRAQMPFLRENRIIVDVPYDIIEATVHRDIAKYMNNPDKIIRFAPLVDLLEAQIVGTIGDFDTQFIGFLSREHLAGYMSFKIGEVRVRAISIYGLLKLFIANYIRAKYFAHVIPPSIPRISPDTFAQYYVALRKLAQIAQECKSLPAEIKSYFEPSITVFGETSLPIHDIIAFYNILAAELKIKPPIAIPPKRIVIKPAITKRDSFDYTHCPFTNISGEEIINIIA
jgi:hypothetical protein